MQHERMMQIPQRQRPVRALAHWRFAADRVKSGSIQAGSLVIEDVSGSGNLIESVVVHHESKGQTCLPLSWTNSAHGEEGLVFYNDRIRSARGCYFQTVKDAPINRERFEQGYTIEAIVRLPQPFHEDRHSWMGVMTRQGRGADIGRKGENELLATLSVSNCKEYQWVCHPMNRDTSVTNWSRYLKADEWHHVVIINDTEQTLLYVNGICDYNSPARDIAGIAEVEGRGWNIGASEWGGRLDKLFSGAIREIRIAGEPLVRADWLIDSKPQQVLQGTNERIVLLNGEDNYNFAFIPDPQKLVYLNPEMFTAQVEWTAQHHGKARIAMTAVLGDIVDHSEALDEWERSSKAIDIMDQCRIPYMMTAGNHDYDADDTYLRYYGPERFAHKDYYKGCSPSRYSSYGVIEAGSYFYVWLMVDMKHLLHDMSWCKGVLGQHRHLPTILVSHDILYAERDGERRIPHDSENGTIIWEELVAPNNQVFMTVNGHYDGAVHRIRRNECGKEVIQLLINYQDSYRGGNGWMRLAEFDERANRISFRTFSPWVERLAECAAPAYPDFRFLTGPYDCFQLPFQFQERFNLE
ncbi:metallophosphoesterase [Paenibacillus profundus]|uniref:Metallophosphoesterase n=1 Tax=Paenibacillus profundus TaxID=1173085 RepID=A0ABS8YKZ5_9BACL|nr:LamG-like jellyroll fold domain-containing protein [Paenibacillus profundus]MCE5171867.1 metallophosphoesterase [Paenibacillus profundus]